MARGLKKRFGDVVALDGVDLELERGGCLGLLGPNGAGKTTTIEILEGLQAADEGQVELFGMAWGTGRDREIQSRIGVALQETQLADKLTVTEVLRLFRSFYSRGHDLSTTLERVGLVEKAAARVHQLSGGQRQRLAVACAMVSDPEILFLDEPTTGLDPQARRKLWEVIGDYLSGGGSALLTTHYMEEAARLCDRIAIVDEGRVIARGTPEELIDGLGAEQVLELETEPRLGDADLSSLAGVAGTSRSPQGGARLAIADLGSALASLLELCAQVGARVVSLETHRPTLEDVFLDLTGKGLRDG
jgi:ABC-2 type transport system ATP-binding protein